MIENDVLHDSVIYVLRQNEDVIKEVTDIMILKSSYATLLKMSFI